MPNKDQQKSNQGSLDHRKTGSQWIGKKTCSGRQQGTTKKLTAAQNDMCLSPSSRLPRLRWRRGKETQHTAASRPSSSLHRPGWHRGGEVQSLAAHKPSKNPPGYLAVETESNREGQSSSSHGSSAPEAYITVPR